MGPTSHSENTLERGSLTPGIITASMITQHGVWMEHCVTTSAPLIEIILGNVTYVDRQTATSSRLTYINDAGNAIVKVDNSTFIQNGPLVFRNSVSAKSDIFRYPIFT